MLNKVASRPHQQEPNQGVFAPHQADGNAEISVLFFLPVFSSFFSYDLGIVFQDIGKAVFLQSLFPEIIGGKFPDLADFQRRRYSLLVERQTMMLCLSDGYTSALRGRQQQNAPHSARIETKLAGIPISLVLAEPHLPPVCLAILFFNSKGITGRPLIKIAISRASFVLSILYCTMGVTLKMFRLYSSCAFWFCSEGVP